MKRLFILTFLLALSTLTLAQKQQGFVKTLGRPNRQGEALSGVTLKVKGSHNTVLSDQNGNFFLTMTDMKNGDAYSLQRVQKSGYELNEIDFIGRTLAFSDKVPLTIVMVSSEQLQADKQRIETTALATAQNNYSDKMSLFEKQLRDNEITKEQYQAAINNLRDKFEKFQSLIDGLATHYAHTDYDQLNEKEREINLCIESGDLERADALLQTLFDPIEDIRRNKEALDNLYKQIEQAHGIITQANADLDAVLKQQEKDAEYLYQLYTIAAARFDNDKALHSIETRAELDTTNWLWQFEAANYCFYQNLIDKAETYYSRVLDILTDLIAEFYDSNKMESANEDEMYQNFGWVSMYFITENNLATIYFKTNRLAESEELYLEVIDFFKGLLQVHPEDMLERTAMGQCLASAQMGLSNLYRQTNRLEESQALNREALGIFDKLETGSSDEAQIKKGQALMTQGLTYRKSNRYKESERCYQEALEIHRTIAKTNPNNEVEVARTLHNYGNLCLDTKRYKESEAMYKEGMEIYERLAKANPQAYEIKLASIMSNLANLYQQTDRLKESEKLYHKALEMERRLLPTNPKLCEPELALTLSNLGSLHLNYSNRYTEAVPPLEEAFEIYKRLAQLEPESYGEKLSISKFNLANVYFKSEKIKESLPFWVDILDEFGKLANDNPNKYKRYYEDVNDFVKDLAPWLVSEAEDLKNEKKYEESEAYYKNALDMYRWFAKSDPKTYEPEIATTLNDLGVLYYQTQRYTECETAYKEALEIKRRITKKGQTEKEGSMAATLNNLGYVYLKTQRYQESETYYLEALEIYRRLAQQDLLEYGPRLAITLNNFALVCKNNQRPTEQENTYLEELEILRRLAQQTPQRYEKDLSMVLYNVGELMFLKKDYQKAITYLEEAMTITQKYTGSNDTLQNRYENILYYLSSAHANIGNHQRCYELRKEYLSLRKVRYENQPDTYRSNYASVMGGQSYQCLFIGRYEEAEQLARESIAIDESKHWLITNLATALLFQGRYNEAEAIYLQYKDELKDSYLDDFKAFEDAGAIPKEHQADVERIKQLINN